MGKKHPTNSLINCKLLPSAQLPVVQSGEGGRFLVWCIYLEKFWPPLAR